MNIYLLNSAFDAVGVTIAIMPLIVWMKHQSNTPTESDILTYSEVFPPWEVETEFELTA